MVFNFMHDPHNSVSRAKSCVLADLHEGESAIIDDLELNPSVADHLMNLGMVPGFEVSVARSAPGGDPRVYRVEGTEVAMRRDLSEHIQVHLLDPSVLLGD